MRFLLTLAAALLVTSAQAADKVVLVAGGGPGADGADAMKAKLVLPFAVDFDSDGNIYFVEMAGGERLRKIDTKGILTTLAGSGKKGHAGDYLTPDKVEFNGMHNLMYLSSAYYVEGKKMTIDLILVADTFNHRIRLFTPGTTAVVVPYAGTGKKGFAGDGGKHGEAEFDQPICIAKSPDAKYFYIADVGNQRIRRIVDQSENNEEKGIVSTFAGTGKAGIPKDGELAKEQPLVDPRAVAADKLGNVYILERSGHALRVVDKAGKIRTVVGTGKAGKGGDGGPALQATMNGPKFISIDPTDDSVLIADTENHQIRRYVPKTGTIELVAGTGKKGSAGIDGVPKKLEMNRPHGVSVHPKTGDIYIADSENHRIVKIVQGK